MPSPNLIPHDRGDHPYVSVEVSSHVWFERCTSNTCPSSIANFVTRDGPNFLKPTSKWTEQHLFAFKCLFFDKLPIDRVLPLAYIPKDDDVTMGWVKKELSATEGKIGLARWVLV
jgi:hypothetical protein